MRKCGGCDSYYCIIGAGCEDQLRACNWCGTDDGDGEGEDYDSDLLGPCCKIPNGPYLCQQHRREWDREHHCNHAGCGHEAKFSCSNEDCVISFCADHVIGAEYYCMVDIEAKSGSYVDCLQRSVDYLKRKVV